MKKKAFISTYPFALFDESPLKILYDNEIESYLNEKKRPLSQDEIAKALKNTDYYLASTEKINAHTLQDANKLKLISRVGIGLDGIDFDYCREKNIKVTYTPEAPTQAVAELTLGLMLDLLRHISKANTENKSGLWQRSIGSLLYGKKVGIIGFGRVGKTLSHLLRPFNVKLYITDPKIDYAVARNMNAKISSFDTILEECDIISLHLPLTQKTYQLIDSAQLSKMKKEALLINTARGEIINEKALYEHLYSKKIAGAGLDVFCKEPYTGDLKNLDNCILTSHMGACTKENRLQMELDAVNNVIRHLKGQSLKNQVFSNNES